jgi:hypothetical protein
VVCFPDQADAKPDCVSSAIRDRLPRAARPSIEGHRLRYSQLDCVCGRADTRGRSSLDLRFSSSLPLQGDTSEARAAARSFFLVPPPRGEGGHIASGANDVTGGGASVCNLTTPPDWPSASHPPHKKGRDKKESSRLTRGGISNAERRSGARVARAD